MSWQERLKGFWVHRERIGSGFPVGFREERDRMNDAEGHAASCAAIDDLQEATGIPGGHDGRAGGGDVVDLAFEKFPGHLGLGDVVNAGATAAPVCLRQFDEF